MHRAVKGLATAVILVAASSLLVNPSLVQAQARDSAPIGCSGDFVCGDDPSVVTQWPLDRWLQVPRAPRQATTHATDIVPPAPHPDTIDPR